MGTENEFESIVTLKDIEKVKKMDKDKLITWTNQPCTFNHVLERARPLAHLRNQVVGMIKVKMGVELDKRIKNGENISNDEKAEFALGYLLNTSNGRVFEATAELLKREDLVPCNKDGKRV